MSINILEALLIFSVNSLLMTIPPLITFMFYRLKPSYTYIYFIASWFIFELIHSNWSFSWPWLILGNSLGNTYYLIQWYSYLGVYSGTLWILILAAILHSIYSNDQKRKRQIYLLLVLFFTPIILSLNLFFSDKKNYNQTQITLYSPNDKIKTNYQKTKKLYNLLNDFENKSIIICPEVYLNPSNIFSRIYLKDFFYLEKFLAENPKSNFVFGLELKSKGKLYNTIFVKSSDKTHYRQKQKYVPVREYIPSWLEDIISIKSYYSKNKFDNTTLIKSQYGFIPLICFESLFSVHTTKLSQNTEFIILGTSEEFMDSSYFGKIQYLNITRIRAIETQKSIVKCSNKGISCVVEPNGDILQKTITELTNVRVNKNESDSFYQKIISF